VTPPARALVALFIANGAAAVLIWWAGLEPSALETVSGRVNAAGRITALVGTYLVLVQLILRTHVPWLVRAFGKDALKAAHTRNAYVAFALIGAHATLQVVGYALQDRVGVIAELGLLVAHYDGMILAIAGTAMLAALTLIAIDQIRHRVPWPVWRALHLYTYVAIALSVPHMIATGSDFIDAPVAVAYWTALEATVLAILVAARVPPVWHAVIAAGRPHPAVVAAGTFAIAAYLVGTVRLSPALETPVAAATPIGLGVARPSATPAAGSSLVAVDGDIIDTPYGNAQVRVILAAGRIVDVEPMLLPSATRHSRTISNAAEPWLRKRAIAAQSAQFDVLSGATYTSRAYMASLESALRAAGVELP
jgi:uncharacterized protein with FMN-binding domain